MKMLKTILFILILTVAFNAAASAETVRFHGEAFVLKLPDGFKPDFKKDYKLEHCTGRIHQWKGPDSSVIRLVCECYDSSYKAEEQFKEEFAKNPLWKSKKVDIKGARYAFYQKSDHLLSYNMRIFTDKNSYYLTYKRQNKNGLAVLSKNAGKNARADFKDKFQKLVKSLSLK